MECTWLQYREGKDSYLSCARRGVARASDVDGGAYGGRGDKSSYMS